MKITAAARAEAARLTALFQAAGANPVEADILLSADVLLDLYGEDIRARAYVTQDPMRGEMMLRPDFTVPVVQMHMETRAAPARYTYSGEVFRKQETDTGRPSEFLQVGYELFAADRAEADAEVFALVAQALDGLPVRAATGDISVLMAAVRSIRTTERRKAALMRHVWRPRRFRALLDRFSGKTPVPASRKALVEAMKSGTIPGQDIPLAGLRGADEIEERLWALVEDATVDPISEHERDLLEDLLKLRGPSTAALSQLRDFAMDLVELRGVADHFDQRLEALARRGVDVDTLEFETSFGRTTLEYYDGFVFGFTAAARLDLPPLATGGRYDALTRVLGQGVSAPAVGAVIRPEAVVALKEGVK